MIAEEEFKKLDAIAAYNSNVEPLKFVFYLLFGLTMGIFSVIFIIQIFTSMLILKGDQVTNYFLNNMLFKI